MRFVALLRGVNVGSARRVPMAAWRELMQRLGYAGVATLLNSGNAVFSAAGGSTGEHAAAIHDALLAQLAVDVPVIVKSAAEVERIVRDNPFASIADDPSRVLVGFAPGPDAIAALAGLAGLLRPPERLHLGADALYLWCPQGILQSKAGEALLGARGRALTTRNAATLAKIAALLQAA